MATTNISKELELKFRRIAQQMLPKGTFSNALVINSGDGLVCQFLKFLKIAEVTGIEGNFSLRQAAQSKLPNVAFFESLSQLNIQQFDLIIILDKVDFLENETEKQTFENISKEAHYVIADMFTYDSMTESAFKTFKLSATEKMSMPTNKKLVSYFPEHLARKVDQAPTHFKHIVRAIWHFRKRLPYAVIVADRPWSGKTTLAKYLFSDLTYVALDLALVKINNKELDSSDAVKNILQAPDCISLGGKKLYQALSDNDCYIDFVKAALSSIDDISKKGIVVDGFVPPEQLDKLYRFLSETGYYVVEVGLTNTLKPEADYSVEQVQNFYNAYYH